MKSSIALLVGLLGLAGSGCGSPPLDALSVPPLPGWTDRYVGPNGPQRFFNISGVMAAEDLTRLQAVELQNHFRDLVRGGQSEAAAYREARGRVKAGRFESGLDPAALKAAHFIVVWDLDETLYDQYHTPKECADLQFEGPPKRAGEAPRAKRILLAPGWRTAFERIKKAGGLSVLFSANLDAPTQLNLAHWKVDGTPLLESGLVAGLMTNSYLVQQDKREGAGAKNPRRGAPVVEPSKDLRPFDETLAKVVIIDDNPSRIFQLRNARSIPKLRADRYCVAGSEERASFVETLQIVVDEVLQASELAQSQEISFAQAWLPYSILGQVKVRHLMESRGWSAKTAAEWVRAHPDAIPSRF